MAPHSSTSGRQGVGGTRMTVGGEGMVRGTGMRVGGRGCWKRREDEGRRKGMLGGTGMRVERLLRETGVKERGCKGRK